MNFNQIINTIKSKSFAPIYFLQGNESYFIDEITKTITDNALETHERDFNQSVFYGKDVSVDEIISSCKRYPMMAERQVIIIKEAQNLAKSIEQFKAYFENPTPSTVLVINYKYKTLRSNSKLLKSLPSDSIVFNSEKIKDYKLPDWILNQMTSLGFKINPKEAILLSDFIGNDLEKINHEIEKLNLILKGKKTITSDLIEKHVGISKEYNLFELSNALSSRNLDKVHRISLYAQNNNKNFPVPVVVGFLYGYFSKIMKFHFSKNKQNDTALAVELKIHPFILREYKLAAQNYPPKKISKIITWISECDLKSKGVGNNTINESELIKELLFKISH